jgi:GNAT superfamily N-acetyltransferase
MLELRQLLPSDVADIFAAFAQLGWNKPASQYQRYLVEAAQGVRTAIVARLDGLFVGYVTIKWESDYPPFRDAAVPEVQDFNVLPDFRRRRIGSRLMDEAEKIIVARSWTAGIGVGFGSDYGAAQRLYVLRGYVPDANGGTSRGMRVKWGDSVTVDDDLVLYFTKTLDSAKLRH